MSLVILFKHTNPMFGFGLFKRKPSDPAEKSGWMQLPMPCMAPARSTEDAVRAASCHMPGRVFRAFVPGLCLLLRPNLGQVV